MFIAIGVCVCLCVYFLLILENGSLLVEPIARNNVSPSDKKSWQFLENFLFAEKLHCKALLLNHHLKNFFIFFLCL